jgi:hypothetical protein
MGLSASWLFVRPLMGFELFLPLGYSEECSYEHKYTRVFESLISVLWGYIFIMELLDHKVILGLSL